MAMERNTQLVGQASSFLDAVERASRAAPLDRPVLVGHSSGAVLALEALAAGPGQFAGAFIYEPPLVLDRPLGG